MGKRQMNSKNVVVGVTKWGGRQTKRRPELCNLTKAQRIKLGLKLK